MTAPARVVVIGVGSAFRSDDAVGLEVLEQLEAERERTGRHPSQRRRQVELVRSDGEPSRLLDAWEGADACIVVDAMATGSPPGTVRSFTIGVDPLPARWATSSHASGVAEAVALGAALDVLPGRIVVIGVEVADVSEGTSLTPAVAAAVPTARRLVAAAIAMAPLSVDRPVVLADPPAPVLDVPPEVDGAGHSSEGRSPLR